MASPHATCHISYRMLFSLLSLQLGGRCSNTGQVVTLSFDFWYGFQDVWGTCVTEVQAHGVLERAVLTTQMSESETVPEPHWLIFNSSLCLGILVCVLFIHILISFVNIDVWFHFTLSEGNQNRISQIENICCTVSTWLGDVFGSFLSIRRTFCKVSFGQVWCTPVVQYSGSWSRRSLRPTWAVEWDPLWVQRQKQLKVDL